MTPQQDVFKVTARRKQPAIAAPPAPSTVPPSILEKPEPRHSPSLLIWLLLGGLLFLLPQTVFAAIHLAVTVTCAAVLEPLVTFCTRRRVPRVFAGLLALVLLGAVVAGLFLWLAPIITKEIAKLTAALNASAPEKVASKLSILLVRALPWLRTKSILQQLQAEFMPRIAAFLQAALSFEVAVLSNVISYVLIALGVFYLLHWGEYTRRKVLGALPNRHLEMGALFWEKVAPRLARYLRAQALLFLCASLMLAAALALMGLPGVFIMSVFGALALLTPYCGALAGAIPLAVAGINASNSLHVVFGVILALATVQLLINVFLSSSRFKLEARLQPWEALLALFLGGSLGGVWGVLLAGPLAGLSKIILREALKVRKSFR